MFDIKTYMKQYWKNNCKQLHENRKEYMKQYRKDNTESIKEQRKQYAKNNRRKINIREKQYFKDRRRTDFKFNLNRRVVVAMGISLKGNKSGRHWKDLVDYTLNDLIKRLEQTIPEGYTWQDFLKGTLQIDHIIPISVFNYTKPEHPDFKRCWALNNLRLLPVKENRIKFNKIEKPFQPALQLC